MSLNHTEYYGILGMLKNLVHKMIVLEQWVCVVFSAIFIVMMMVQVVMRYLFVAPIYGIEEWVTAMMIWYCSMGVVVVYWEKGHAMIGFMTKYMNNGTQKFVLILSELIVIIIACVFIKTGLNLFWMQKDLKPIGGVPFNKSLYYASPIIVMGITMVIAGLFRLVETVVTKDVRELANERVSLD